MTISTRAENRASEITPRLLPIDAKIRPTSPRGIMPMPTASRRMSRSAPQPLIILPAMAAAIMRDFKTVDRTVLLSAASVPVRAVNAAANPPARPATTIELNCKYGDFDAVFIDGVGHFPQLERPEEFNSQLRAVLAELEEK